MLILYELWAGERLSFEKAHPRYLRPGRPIPVSAVPFGVGIDIWRSCRFIGALIRSLCVLPGGLGRFVPCSTGAYHCTLRHVGWERCSHGRTSRPRESESGPFFGSALPVIPISSLVVWCSASGLFLFGIGLLVGSLFGLCLFLVMLLG